MALAAQQVAAFVTQVAAERIEGFSGVGAEVGVQKLLARVPGQNEWPSYFC